MTTNPDVDLGSITGIAAATIAIVELLKRSIAGRKIDKLPTPFWVLLVAAGLTGVSKYLGYLSIPWETAFGQVVVGALTASGAFSWWVNGSNTLDGTPALPPSSVAKNRALAILMTFTVVSFAVIGCADPLQAKEKVFYEGAKSTWQEIKADWTPRVQSATDLTEQEKLNRVGPKDSLASEMDKLFNTRGKDLSNAAAE